MPYFSFSLKPSSFELLPKDFLLKYKLKPNIKYFSKSTYMWKILNKKIFYTHLQSLNYEKRSRYIKGKKSVIFLIPPSIGLGDSIEYALAINSIIKSKLFNKIGIAFVGNYEFILKKIFNFKNIFSHVISEKQLLEFDTTFHFSNEIEKIKNQKYDRSDIELEICNFFNIKIKRLKNINVNKVNKLTIFPISTSPLRNMPLEILNSIVKKFSNKIKLEIVVDDYYITSNYIINNIDSKNVKLIFHKSLPELYKIVKKMDYGIFMDSGPLHLAKVLNKNGLFIETTVNNKILLNKYNNFKIIKNLYNSKYCEAPCGLTNLFNFNNQPGCYETHKIDKKLINKINNRNSMQRGSLKNSYNKFLAEPVGCIKNIDLQNILKTINSIL